MFSELVAHYEAARKAGRGNPAEALQLGGLAVCRALEDLNSQCESYPLAWKGQGEKEYKVFSVKGDPIPFSRPVNQALFVPDSSEFMVLWEGLTKGVDAAAGDLAMPDVSAAAIDRGFYTAVISYAACMDLVGLGGAGTFFEMLIRPVLSILTGRAEAGQVALPIPGEEAVDRVPVDLSFPPGEHDPSPVLVVASKISTRERISQAYVHQLFLDRLSPGRYRSVMAIGNETNVVFKKGTAKGERAPSIGWVIETLVPGTIAKYERYVAKLSGLYYLDPPLPYIEGKHIGLPPVRRFSDLLRSDLPAVLAPAKES